MKLLSIITVLVFAAIMCIYEIPQMLKTKSTRDLWAFSLLLGLGVSLAVLRSLNVTVSNPSDWLAWIFSPLAGLLKKILE